MDFDGKAHARFSVWLRTKHRSSHRDPAKVWLLTFSKVPCYSVEHCWYTPVNRAIFSPEELPRPQFFWKCTTRKPDDCSTEQEALQRLLCLMHQQSGCVAL